MRQARERLGNGLESPLNRQTRVSAPRLPPLAPVLPGPGSICNLGGTNHPPSARSGCLWEPSCAVNGLLGTEDGRQQTES